MCLILIGFIFNVIFKIVLKIRTKTNAKFKARALQYCLEHNVTNLRDEDWVVHLDEETLLTLNSVFFFLFFNLFIFLIKLIFRFVEF